MFEPFKPASSVTEYLNARVRREDGRRVPEAILYEDYCRWCAGDVITPIDSREFKKHVTAHDVEYAHVEGKRYLDVALKDDA